MWFIHPPRSRRLRESTNAQIEHWDWMSSVRTVDEKINGYVIIFNYLIYDIWERERDIYIYQLYIVVCGISQLKWMGSKSLPSFKSWAWLAQTTATTRRPARRCRPNGRPSMSGLDMAIKKVGMMTHDDYPPVIKRGNWKSTRNGRGSKKKENHL